MGLGAAVLVAAAVPVGAFFGRLDAGRTHPGGAEALASMPTGLVSFAPGLIGFGLVALLTRALYVRGRPGHAGRWVAAGWLVAGLGPLVVLAGGADSRATLVALGVGSSLGMTLAAGGLLVSVRSAWGPAAVEGLRRSLAVAVLRRRAGRRRRPAARAAAADELPRRVGARRRAHRVRSRPASTRRGCWPSTGTPAGCSSPG